MARIRLNLKNLSITDKLAKGRRIVTAMTNNASFPTPNALVQAAKSEVSTRAVYN
jgi:hypothetical protein